MIKRIPKCYVGENVVQVRIPFDKNISVISSDFKNDGILCHYDFESDSQCINKYITDYRRTEFPYGKIPLYKEMQFELFEDIEYINYSNQFIEFNKHYLSVTDDFCVRDMYVVKENEEAIIYSRLINMPKNVTERDITRKYFEEEYKNNFLVCVTRKGHLISLRKDFGKFFNDKGGLIVLNDKDGVKFKLVELVIRGHYLFMKEYDIPFNHYTLEELKYLSSKIKNVSEPKIYLKFNPNIDRKDIREAKKLVRKLNR